MQRSIVRRPLNTVGSRVGAMVAVAASVVGVAAPAAHAEIVSKLPGAGGLPFPAQFVDASTDGRYVVLKVGAWQWAPPAPGPEAPTAPLGAYALRDRAADTTIPLTFRVAPGEPAIVAEPVQISDDADRVLIRGSDPALRAFSGAGTLGLAAAVYDRSEDRLLKLPTAPTDPTFGDTLWLSADGTQAMYRAFHNSPTSEVYPTYRGPVGGTGTAVLDLPRAYPEGASADLQTVVYTRQLVPARRPVAEFGRPNDYFGAAVGVRVGLEEPVVLDESHHMEQAPFGECITDADVITRTKVTANAFVAPDASRVAWLTANPGDPGPGWYLSVRSADGILSFPPVDGLGGTAYPHLSAFGNANQKVFSDPVPNTATVSQEFADGDTELIGSAEGRDGNGAAAFATRYTEAKPYSGAPVAQQVPPFDPSGLGVDYATRGSMATWYSCPPPAATAPIGLFTDYVKFPVNTNYSTRYLIGSATVDTAPRTTIRAASKITAELTVFGISYWRRTITSDAARWDFPKPFWGIPMNLRITVQPKAAPGQAAPAALYASYPIWTIKTN